MSSTSSSSSSPSGPAVSPKPPRRAARRPAVVAGADATVNRYIAAYIMGVANRLANGASQHYRSRFNLGMSEWRTIMAVGNSDTLIVRQVAEQADLDYAAASKSLRLLQSRGLIAMEQTARRGRAALASLTPDGLQVYKQLLESSRRRQKRLLAGFTPHEVQQLWSLLRRVEAQIPLMNSDS